MAGGFDDIKPAGMAWTITPSDSTEFKVITRQIVVGGAGDLTCWVWNPETGKWSAETWTGLLAGTQLAVQTKKVMATGTTATNLKAMA